MLGTENKNCLRSQDGCGIVLWAFGRSCGGSLVGEARDYANVLKFYLTNHFYVVLVFFRS